jgi:drug/metabolite transporter (DMT)-like permease
MLAAGVANYAIIITCVVVVALGQLLFKTVGTRLGANGFEAMLHDHKAAALFLLALALYGMSTLGWVLALRNVPLSTAYLFMSLSFVIVPTLAFFWLGEPLSPRFMVGSLLIVCGIVLAAS